jgi:hypothetical protein
LVGSPTVAIKIIQLFRLAAADCSYNKHYTNS